jgi:heme-degrading monooxygenase HmoA
MYARSSAMVAQTSSIDRGIAFLGDELMGELIAIDGCVGVSLLANRETGRCIATSSWENEEKMHASEGRVHPLRARLMTAFGAPEMTTDEWDVVVMHRDHNAPEGAHARVSYLKGDPARSDRWSENFKSLLPALEGYSGFCSANLLVNRESGRAVSNVILDSREALTQSNEQAKQLRARIADQMGAEIVEVAEFELALAHLRVPELV